MVSQATKDILTSYNLYRARNNQSTVKYTASNQVAPKDDVSLARANLAQAQSREAIQIINEKMNANQQDIERVVNDYRAKNPNNGQAQMNQDLRTQSTQYGGLIDDQRNLQEQKRTLEEKLIKQEYVAGSDLNQDADRDFNAGLSISSSVMDDQKTSTPVTYSTLQPQDRETTGTLADQNFGKVSQTTIDSIYARQNQDKIDNAVQSNHFWQLRAGKTPVGKALYAPETKNTYFSGDTELSDMANKTQRMELTKLYLEERGQSMDTPIGNVKFSPTKYTESRNRASESVALNAMGIKDQMGDLTKLAPSLTKKGDYTGYIAPDDYRQRITTSSPSEYNSNQKLIGTGTLTPEMNLAPSLASFTASTKFEDKLIMGGGNIPSMLGGINFLMYGNLADPPKEDKVEGDKDWLGGEITEIPDDPFQQFGKGLSAEPFNIVQTGKQVVTGKEQAYAPSLIGDTLEAFGSGEIDYKDYGDDFGDNVNTFFENASRTVTGLQDPEVQGKIGDAFGEFGERVQKYPIYYIGSGITEVGSMILPVGKISTGVRVATKGIGATKTAVKAKSLDPIKEAIKSTDKQAVEIAQKFAGDKTVTLVKQKGKSFVFIEKVVKDLDLMPKMTTKTKEIVKTKIRFLKKDGSGKLQKPIKEQRVLSSQGATIEKLGDKRFLVNLGEGQSGKGFGYAIIDLKNSRTGVIMKEFNPLEKPPRWVAQATTKDVPVEQLGNINWISNKALKGDSLESGSLIRTLQKGRKEATGGEPLPKSQFDYLFDEGLVSQQPVYLFRGGKPFMPVRNPVTRGETVKDYFLTQAHKVGLKKKSKTLMQKDRGGDPDWVKKSYRIGGDTIYKDEIFKGYKVPKSKETRYTESVEFMDKARTQREFRETLHEQSNKGFWDKYKQDWATGAGGKKGGSKGGGKKGGGKKGDGGDKSNKGNDGSSTKQVYKDFSDPSIPIDKHAVDEMVKVTNTPNPTPNVSGGLPFGSMFAPMAYGQTAPQVRVSTPPQSVQPAPRIGTTSLFRQQPAVQASASAQQTKSFSTQKVIPKTEPLFNTRINTNVIPQIKTDIVSLTDQTVKHIGAVSTQLDLRVRQDLIPNVKQITTQKLGQISNQKQMIVPKVNQMIAPKAIIENKKVTPARPIPSMFRAPPLPIMPFNLQTGGRNKKKKKSKKKGKEEATAWAVPDVWFDAKGYYFSKGNAYVKGAKAKNPPKPKRVKKSKR